MAMPTNADARVYYRAAGERMTDARLVLDQAQRTTAAVYLAGYAVECMLKALILSQLATAPRREMRARFRGAQAHDFDWLRQQYLGIGGPPLPKPVVAAFALLADWGTELRYNPGRVGAKDAVRFLAAAESVMRWADERI